MSNLGFPAQPGTAPEDEGKPGENVGPEPTTPAPDDTELNESSASDDDDLALSLEEPVQGSDESDEGYSARRRSWNGKRSARTRNANKATASKAE